MFDYTVDRTEAKLGIQSKIYKQLESVNRPTFMVSLEELMAELKRSSLDLDLETATFLKIHRHYKC